MNILNEMSALTDLLNTTLSQEMQSTNSSIGVCGDRINAKKFNTVSTRTRMNKILWNY